MIRLGRSERMSGLLPSSWMKSGEEEIEEQGAGGIDTEYEKVDEIDGEFNVQITENDTRNEEERQMITDILEIMRSGRMGNGADFKRVHRKGLAEWTKKVNRVEPEIQTTTITDTNQVGLKIGGCEGKGSK